MPTKKPDEKPKPNPGSNPDRGTATRKKPADKSDEDSIYKGA